MRQTRLPRRKRALMTALSLATLASSSAALAANQVQGASYSGELQNRPVKVSFKVSGNGKQVSNLKTNNLPLYCEGGGPPLAIPFANAKITGQGTFTSTGKYIVKEGPLKGQLEAKLKLSGKFLKGGKETGTLTTTYVKDPKCSGKSSYSTSKA